MVRRGVEKEGSLSWEVGDQGVGPHVFQVCLSPGIFGLSWKDGYQLTGNLRITAAVLQVPGSLRTRLDPLVFKSDLVNASQMVPNSNWDLEGFDFLNKTP